MSSRRRSRSRSRDRARGSSGSSKLRMDTKPQSTRITDPSLPAGRRREIDNVMKKARASPNSNIYWDKKLLEVEAKDPNRWRHSGYKSMYLDGSSSRSPSPGHLRRSRSRSRSLPPSRRSPPIRGAGRSPRSPRSPPPGQSHNRDVRRSPRSPPPPVTTRSNRPSGSARPRSPPIPTNRGPSTQQQQTGIRRRRSASASSMSSCSDDSCSVCSPKAGRHRSRSRSRSPPRPVMPRPKFLPPAPADRRQQQQAPPSGSSGKQQLQRSQQPPSPNTVAPPRPGQQRMPRPMTPPSAASGSSSSNNHNHPRRVPATIPPQRRSGSNGPPPTDPRRQPPPARPRNRAGEVIDVSANVKPMQMPQPKIIPQQPVSKQTRQAVDGGVGSSNEAQQPVLLSRIKKERTGPKRVSSPNNAGDSSGSEDSSDNSTSAIVATTRLTLSERFGKMAQWSVDRERRIKDNNIENMRITKTGGDLKVMIEADAFLYGDAPRRYSISPVPAGHYPDDLLAAGPTIRGAAWDDVRVRYQYYKDLGYLRDLTLDDYVKWEEWWYKYQDWLANEREYEHWLATQEHRGGGGHGGRRRRKRLPASQRLN